MNYFLLVLSLFESITKSVYNFFFFFLLNWSSSLIDHFNFIFKKKILLNSLINIKYYLLNTNLSLNIKM